MNICTACMNNKVFKVRVTYAYVQNNEESNICINKGHNKYKAINTLWTEAGSIFQDQKHTCYKTYTIDSYHLDP